MKARAQYYEPPCDSDDDCSDIGCFRVWQPNGQRLAGQWCEKHANELVRRMNATCPHNIDLSEADCGVCSQRT